MSSGATGGGVTLPSVVKSSNRRSLSKPADRNGTTKSTSFAAVLSTSTDGSVGGAAPKGTTTQSTTFLPHQSKLCSEVDRLTTKGTALLKKEGYEVEGIAMLGKALWARTRFPILQREGEGAPWQHGEAFVIACNETAAHTVQTLQEGAPLIANQIMRHAETALTDDDNDSFAGFHPLRQHLLGATLNNIASLQRLNGEPVEDIVVTLERALRAEGGRLSTLTLFNLAAVYVQSRRYDDAMEAVTRCIELADHYLTLPVTSKGANSVAWETFVFAVATHATLAHLLISTLSSWTGMQNVALHHSQLALSCAMTHLGKRSALTSRCCDRLETVKRGGPHIFDEEPLLENGGVDERRNTPPLVPLHNASFGSRVVPPSSVLPFALALPLPQSTTEFVQKILAKKDPARGGLFPALVVPQQSGADATNRRSVPTLSVTRGDEKKELRRAMSSSSLASSMNLEDVTIMSTSMPKIAATPTKGPSTQRKHAAGHMAIPPIAPRPFLATPENIKEQSRVPSANANQPQQQQHIPAPPSSHHRGGGSASRGTSASSKSTTSAVIAPRPPDSVKHVVTSVIPKAQLLVYQKLQAEIQHQLQQSGEGDGITPRHTFVGGSGIPRASSYYQRSGTGPNLRSRSPVEDTQAGVHSPTSLLMASDLQLRELSILRPDHTDADELIWRNSAIRIQKTYRGYRSRRNISRPRRDRAHRWIDFFPAAECILSAWRTYCLCKPVIDMKKRLRREKYLREAITVIQAHCRHKFSLTHLKNVWEHQVRDAREMLRRQQVRLIATLLLQAWMRGCLARNHVARRHQAAARIQRMHRKFVLYRIVRIIVFKRRIRRREFVQMLFTEATKIQRWWRLYLPARRAVQELQRRRLALQSHFEQFWAKDLEYWAKVSHLDDDICKGIVFRWAKAFRVRRMMYHRMVATRRATGAARMIQRWYRFVHANHALQRRKEAYRLKMKQHRRIQEVKEAAIDIQKTVRMMLAKARVARIRSGIQRRHDAARVIQTSVRRMIRRGTYHAMQEARHKVHQRYLTAQSRQFAATKLQSTWRMKVTRDTVKKLRQFFFVDRHIVATVIQKLLRCALAKNNVKRRHEQKQLTLLGPYVRERQYCAARKLQSFTRMVLTRKRLREQAAARKMKRRVVFPTSYRRRIAVTLIQTYWRRFAAQMYAHQLRQARLFCDAKLIHQEHVHVYATVLQCAVRKFILTPNRVHEARMRHRERSACTIQRFVKGILDRKKALVEMLKQEEREMLQYMREEHHFAAVRIQKHMKGLVTRRKYRLLVSSAVRIQSAIRSFLARRERRDRRRHRDEEAAKILAQEESDAALSIQRAWRLHCNTTS